MKLWQLDEAQELREHEPTLHAAVWWALGEAARERGDFAECADRFQAIRARHVNHDHMADVFANEADCLAADGRADEAAKLRAELVRRLPYSDAAKRLTSP